MSLMDLNKPAETVAQPVFRLHGMPYLPHYSFKHTWVSPGREHECKKYTTTELTELGARLKTMQLWKRYWTDEVQGWKAL
jgi:hypothetical protein